MKHRLACNKSQLRPFILVVKLCTCQNILELRYIEKIRNVNDRLFRGGYLLFSLCPSMLYGCGQDVIHCATVMKLKLLRSGYDKQQKGYNGMIQQVLKRFKQGKVKLYTFEYNPKERQNY